jgi:hypothetical protein
VAVRPVHHGGGVTVRVTGLALALLAAVLVIAGVTAPGVIHAPGASATTSITVTSHAIGNNVAPWEWSDTQPGYASLYEEYMGYLTNTTFRYGGGSWADAYDWQTNSDVYTCSSDGEQTSNFSAPCAESADDVLPYSAYISEAKATPGAKGMVTVNYGSGTPALAAAWAAQVKADGDPVSEFEVGNEQYGCWETDIPVTQAPEDYTSYEPNVNADCPFTTQGDTAGMQTLANSYVAHEPAFYTALKGAYDGDAVVVPYEIASQSCCGNAWVWNQTVLSGADFNGVDAHYYPGDFSGDVGAGGNPSAATILSWLTDIPSEAASIQSDINTYSPGKFFQIGESNISGAETNAVCLPVGAVFAAGEALEWLLNGATHVAWWDQSDGTNSTSCTSPDFGMFDNTAVPQTPFWGFAFITDLVFPGEVLSLDPGNTNPEVLAFHGTTVGGQQVELDINLSTSSSEVTSVPELPPGSMEMAQYSAGTQNSTNSEIVNSTTTLAALGSSVTLPAESITEWLPT